MKKPLHVTIDEKLLNEFKEKCKDNSINMSSLTQRWIEIWLRSFGDDYARGEVVVKNKKD